MLEMVNAVVQWIISRKRQRQTFGPMGSDYVLSNLNGGGIACYASSQILNLPMPVENNSPISPKLSQQREDVVELHFAKKDEHIELVCMQHGAIRPRGSWQLYRLWTWTCNVYRVHPCKLISRTQY